MRKIINPFSKDKNHNCFACDPRNPFGLKMEFYMDGDDVYSEWQPQKNFQGYQTVLHGGIQATLIDEIACWILLIKLNTAGVTSRINIKYLKPVYTDEGRIKLKASLKSMKRNIAIAYVELFDAEDVLCSVGEVSYFMYDREFAKEKLNFPDADSFLENN